MRNRSGWKTPNARCTFAARSAVGTLVRVAVLVAIVAPVGVLALPARAAAQIDGPAVFEALGGHWTGEGTLMGRDARFSMRWAARDGGFYELAFSNAFVSADGQTTPVLSSMAIYRPSGERATGVWIDTRPQRIQLSSELTDSTLITMWTAPEERGRTEYRVVDGGVVVTDFVEVDGDMRPFGEARYTRVR